MSVQTHLESDGMTSVTERRARKVSMVEFGATKNIIRVYVLVRNHEITVLRKVSTYNTPESTYFRGKITYLAGFGREGQNIGRFSINLGARCQGWI